uniref:C-type lectin domain-containing protein n=1 Tax=Anopheles atroparvus TaxID=41427 RepID=A0AAG5D7A3_ANOAO
MIRPSALVCLYVFMFLQGQVSLQKTDITFAINRQEEYFFSDNLKANWFGAFQHCRTLDKHLVSIRNDEERRAVINFLDSTGYTKANKEFKLWISGNDLAEEGMFYWASTGERLTYQNWRSEEPNDYAHDRCTGEDCVILEYIDGAGRNYDYTFDDRPCIRQFPFICESIP